MSETLRNLLPNLSQPLELCDESGRVVGRVIPALDLSEYEPREPVFDDEDLCSQAQANEKRYAPVEELACLENSHIPG